MTIDVLSLLAMSGLNHRQAKQLAPGETRF
jgi:hypothetical protein